MHRILLASSTVGLVLALTACGGADESFGTSRSAASASLSTPGSATLSADGSTVTLAGGNTASAGGCGAGAQYGVATGPCDVSASFAGGRTFTFDWSYTTTDTSGPGADPFGIVVDGKLTPLSDPGGALTQSGQVQVFAAQSLRLYVNCTDCTDGAAQATVTKLDAR